MITDLNKHSLRRGLAAGLALLSTLMAGASGATAPADSTASPPYIANFQCIKSPWGG